MSSNTKLHARHNLGTGNIYNYRFDAKNGMDIRLMQKQGDSHKAALLKNLYRNKAYPFDAVESFGGYRRILSSFDSAGELNGAFRHRFGEDDCLILHIGTQLYILSHALRHSAAAPQYLADIADAPSSGVSVGNLFYLFDQKHVYKLSSPHDISLCGDEAYTDEMEDLGKLPETSAYVPLAYRDGKPYESKNLLTAYYELSDTTNESRRVYHDYGLKLRSIVYGGAEALEVYGIEAGRRILFVPNEAEVMGKMLPIVRIAPAAFSGTAITTAVISENVKEIAGEGESLGAFAYCYSLERVCLFGVQTIGERAFEFCDGLKEIVLPESLTIVDGTAFSGADALERVYYEGEAFDSAIYAFDETVKVFASTLLYTVSVGEEVRFPIDPDKYMNVYGLSETSREAVSTPRRYGGWTVGVLGDDIGYSVVAKKPIALSGLCFDCHLSEEDDRYVFMTVLGDAPLFTAIEEPTAVYEIPLPDDVNAIASLTVDGVAASYKSVFGYRDGVTYLKAIRLVFPCEKTATVRLRIFSSGRDIGVCRRYYPATELSASDIVNRTRVAAVKRGTLYLSGIPTLPGIVLTSASPERESEGLYFPVDGIRKAGDTRVTGLLPCKDRMAVLSEQGVFYLESGVIAEDIAAYDALVYRDIRYFLLSDGVYRLDEGVSVSYTHLKKLSMPIEGAIDDYSKGRLLVWQGYLVLLFGNTAYLADLDRSYREDGEELHPWYMLSELGDQALTPFVKAVSIEDWLYFFTASGEVYLVDPDIVDYTYDGRAIETLLVSEAHDLDCGYLLKTPYRKSMTLSYLTIPEGEITVSVEDEGKEERHVATLSAAGEERLPDTVCLPQYKGRFLRQRIRLLGKRFSFISLAFRYTVSRRRVK